MRRCASSRPRTTCSGIDSVLEHLARLSASQGDSLRAVRLAAAASRVRGLSQSGIVDVAYLGSSGPDGPEIAGCRRTNSRRRGRPAPR